MGQQVADELSASGGEAMFIKTGISIYAQLEVAIDIVVKDGSRLTSW